MFFDENMDAFLLGKPLRLESGSLDLVDTAKKVSKVIILYQKWKFWFLYIFAHIFPTVIILRYCFFKQKLLNQRTFLESLGAVLNRVF